MDRTMDEPKKSLLEIAIFGASLFAGSSVAGWAYQLYLDEKIPLAKKVGGIVLSGLAGVIVAMLLWNRIDDRVLIIGLSLLAGIGGASTIDWLIAMLRRRAMRILGETNE